MKKGAKPKNSSNNKRINSSNIKELDSNTEIKTPVRGMLFDKDPYADFDHDSFPLDLHGWGSDSDVFRELIEAVRPNLIIEVGSWKGASAVTMAKACDALSLSAEIVCIDTWLGAPEFWQDHADPERYGSLKLLNGYPSVYFQFLANIQKSGHASRVTPMPLSSTAAATFLSKNGVKAELIYVDASHETNDVLLDMAAYFPLLEVGGVLFGDDMDGAWPSVERAVHLFAMRNGLHYEVKRGRYWMIHKAAEIQPLDVQNVYELELPAPVFIGATGALHRLASRIVLSRVFYPNEDFVAAAVNGATLMVHPPLHGGNKTEAACIRAEDVPAAPRSVLTGTISAAAPERQVLVTALVSVANDRGQRRLYEFPLLPGFKETRFTIPLALDDHISETVSVSFSAQGPQEGVATCCAVSWSDLQVRG